MAIKTCPHCKSDRVFLRESTLWRNCNDSTDTIHIDPMVDEWNCFDCCRMTSKDKPVEIDPQVCSECGSSNVYLDCYVAANDPTDVKTKARPYCDDCWSDSCSIIRKSEYLSKENN